MRFLREHWSNLRLRTKGLIVVAFPAAATVVIACAAYLIGSQVERAEDAVNRTLDVHYATQRLKTSEIEVSAAHRGYLITRDEAFANSVRDAIAAFDLRQQELGVLVADDPEQKRRLAGLGSIQRSRVERIIATIARLGSGVLPGPDMAAVLRVSELERLDMDRLITAMLNEEERLLAVRTQRVQVLRHRMQAVIGICVFFGVAGGLIISLLFASGITSRIGRLQANVARQATSGVLDPGPDGRDEIGMLSDGIARAAEILRQKTTALENALHGIVQADDSGRYLSYNKAYGKLLGVSDGDGPADILSSVHPEDRAEVGQAISKMRLEGRGEAEVRIPRADGSMARVVMTFLPMTADTSGGYHVFVRDISLQKEAEGALIRAKDAALASNRARTEFLAKISHDIRTPLNAILGAADLLSQTVLNRDQDEYVSMFQRNCRRLVALINDFLDFSRIEAGAVRVERVPFRVRQLADDVARTFHESAARKGVAVTVEIAPDVPDWMMGDPLRIQQVLVNLLSNALKFTCEGRVSVRLSVSSAEPGQNLRFEVADTGPGIPAADQERIFAPFTQLRNQSATSTQGSGLGLTICRELVQLMDGEIGVTSEDGTGATFHFSVPLERAQPNYPTLAGSRMPGSFSELRAGDPRRILIAEDTEDNRVLLRHYLRDQPVVLEFAENGHEAVAAVRRPGDYDLILMDIDMPGLDGRAATREIQEWEGAAGRPPTPIVALSAHAIHEQVRACLDAGCVAHVAKPVDQATLIETIERYARAPRSVAVSKRLAVSPEVAALVPNYLASKPRQIEEALAHLAGRNFEPIRRFGHNLKGTGRGYGFPEIEELGRALEKATDDGDERLIARHLLALHRLVTEETVSVS